MTSREAIDELAELYQRTFAVRGSPDGVYPAHPPTPYCHGRGGLLVYLSAESDGKKEDDGWRDEPKARETLGSVRRLHDSVTSAKSQPRKGLDWYGLGEKGERRGAWCNPINEGLTIVVARYVHQRLSDPAIPERMRLSPPEGTSPFAYVKTIAMGNLIKFTPDPDRDPRLKKDLVASLPYIIHDLDVIQPKVVLVHGNWKRCRWLGELLEKERPGGVPRLLQVNQPQARVMTNEKYEGFDPIGLAVKDDNPWINTWMKGVAKHRTRGHRLLGQAHERIEKLLTNES